MKLSELVLDNYTKLNETDLLIWNYIAAHKEEVSQLTINDLAQKTNVSRTTISRFVRKIKLRGYSELKVLLRLEQESLNSFDTKVFDFTCDSLIQYIDNQKHKNYKTVCQLIYQAKRVFVYGSGDVQMSVAKQIKRMFTSAKEVIYDFAGTTFDHAMYEVFTEKDVIIMISLSGNSKKVVEIARRLKLLGVKIISITEFKNNQLAEFSDENLYIDSINLNFLQNHPNYKITMPYFLLAELLFIQYAIYKNEQLLLQGKKEIL
ncbi:MurR/RpiR family transcriptional regulator [Streptococcus chenjunshii]|uniref:MurR/RpiR family transcriptional regulator n=1 Tax=Streptococcus chenjunshii TaxID=2173853 RepID=A0A372KL17_9STRE|nr:MurR/RpiR family transcriptional regulator [Streptococcus chenjunshii]AXQ77732.1 MurR/RpiR family transcriptional regulator [Streptococcus chenjunshii]RFU50826.1 MurR/RpiR family transcriptional regulator [Streptococcus chenjunshii]RFU52972.1 MurR/RpiR family transcriptional regulator [Streptococcus chenjunshii]